ncbi:hypothetical protein GA707_19555 [Nostocoides sp. F2B08]|uniref:hypothetical protein n=1 Tax=Nostocoides sp. F2B08 TaxID=2653936 RepID=UPI001262B076|nr:hypothetical protein [Tetrasphaera sp. F2B08]KAB7740352.1 hypothetical protein GA707_19555 [Tetrasphaera sp. F2B08]
MIWWELFDPFAALGNAATKVAADAWTGTMLSVWNAALWVLRVVLTIEDHFLTPQLSLTGPMAGIYRVTFWIAGVLVVIFVAVQLGIAAIRRDGQSLARVLIGAAQYVMVWAGWIVYAVAVLAAAGGLTKAMMRELLDVDQLAAWQPWAPLAAEDLTETVLATVLGMMGFLLLFGAVAHLLVMLTRAGALMILAATAPIAAAGLVWEGGRSWFWKTFRWFHAAAFTPVLMMLMLGLGVQVSNGVALGWADSLAAAIGSAVPAVLLIFIGAFSPLALFKLLAFVDPGTSSGAAMRAGLVAEGGIQGLLRGGSSAGSSAASTADDTGRSQGEASSEAATSQRAAQTGGGMLAAFGGGAGQVASRGLGLAVTLGTTGASVGADLANQMGVGHNTYIPDMSRTRAQTGKDPANPQVHGADPASQGGGSSGGAAPSAGPQPGQQPPMPAPPTQTAPAGGAGGTPGAPSTSGTAAGGGAAAGGAAGAAGSVPVVPV